jgi:NitT/TauT family transport system permease protein
MTTIETLLAFIVGSFLGVVFGLLFARIPTLARLFDPYIKIANALPRIALAPIFTLWFGLGILSKVAFGVTLVFFIVFFNTYRGVREVDPNIFNNARMLGASERDLFRHVFLPSAMSWILASLHTSVGMALVGAVVGEYLGAAKGLGYLIAQAEGVFDTTGVFTGLVVLSIFVLLIDLIVTLVERWLLKWRPEVLSS